jgi:hypothetical protein
MKLKTIHIVVCVCVLGRWVGAAATWSVTRDESKLRVFQNRVLRMTVASKRKAAVSEFTLCTRYYRVADKSLARPGRKLFTVTEDFDVHISCLLS